MTSTPSDDELTDLLARAAGGVPAGAPAPGLLHRARRARRRRTAATVAGTAAACVTLAGTAFGLQQWADRPSIATMELPSAASPPAGMQVRGIGALHVLLPAEWKRGSVLCGGGGEAGAVWRFDSDAVFACAGSFPESSTQVTLSLMPKYAQIDVQGPSVPLPGGGEGFRSDVSCMSGWAEAPRTAAPASELCTGSVIASVEGTVTGRMVVVTVESTRGAPAVNETLDAVHVGQGVGVPPFQDATGTRPLSPRASTQPSDDYLSLLEQMGLRAEMREVTASRTYEPAIVGVAPEEGTIVERGSAVSVEFHVGASRDERGQ